jgi:uncharacterized damage-inducible protein DinB
MFRRVEDFLKAYKDDSSGTLKLLNTLTDESLNRRVAEGHRELGAIAWHIAMSIPEMMPRTGLKIEGFDVNAMPPAGAAEIAATYRRAVDALLAQVAEQWDDATLEVEDDMYGMQWPRGLTLFILIAHETHHRGQMTVLMRQAGLTVPGVCGPAKEEWDKYGMEGPPY